MSQRPSVNGDVDGEEFKALFASAQEEVSESDDEGDSNFEDEDDYRKCDHSGCIRKFCSGEFIYPDSRRWAIKSEMTQSRIEGIETNSVPEVRNMSSFDENEDQPACRLKKLL